MPWPATLRGCAVEEGCGVDDEAAGDGVSAAPVFAADALLPAVGVKLAAGLAGLGFGVSSVMAAKATSPLRGEDNPVAGFAAAFSTVARTWDGGRAMVVCAI